MKFNWVSGLMLVHGWPAGGACLLFCFSTTQLHKPPFLSVVGKAGKCVSSLCGCFTCKESPSYNLLLERRPSQLTGPVVSRREMWNLLRKQMVITLFFSFFLFLWEAFKSSHRRAQSLRWINHLKPPSTQKPPIVHNGFIFLSCFVMQRNPHAI